MTQKKRQQRSPDLKAAIVLEVLTGKISVPAAARKYKIKDSVIYGWRNEVIEKLPLVFSTKTADEDSQEKIAELERLIGQQAIEIEALKKAGRWLSRLSCRRSFRDQATDREGAGANTRRRDNDVSVVGIVGEQLLLCWDRLHRHG